MNTNIFVLRKKGKYKYDYIWVEKKGKYEYEYNYLDWYSRIQIQIFDTHWFRDFKKTPISFPSFSILPSAYIDQFFIYLFAKSSLRRSLKSLQLKLEKFSEKIKLVKLRLSYK